MTHRWLKVIATTLFVVGAAGLYAFVNPRSEYTLHDLARVDGRTASFYCLSASFLLGGVIGILERNLILKFGLLSYVLALATVLSVGVRGVVR